MLSCAKVYSTQLANGLAVGYAVYYAWLQEIWVCISHGNLFRKFTNIKEHKCESADQPTQLYLNNSAIKKNIKV